METSKPSTAELPLVTIVTVSLNAASTIETSIKSVLHQTYPSIEYIIIDGGSTDGTLDVINRYEDRIDLWISESDAGISDAFNKGIAQSHGGIIGIISATDWYEPDAVSAVVQAFRCEPDVGVVCGWLQFWRDGRRDYVFRSAPHLLSKEMTVNHPTMFVSRAVYERLGVFRPEYHYAMDYDLALRFAVNNVRFASLNQILAHMRSGGVTTRSWKQAYYEVKLAKLGNGQAFFSTEAYYRFQLFRWRLRVCLQRIGLESAVRVYRAHLSTLKKTADP